MFEDMIYHSLASIGLIRDSTLVKLVEINYQISNQIDKMVEILSTEDEGPSLMNSSFFSSSSSEDESTPQTRRRRFLRIRNKFHQEGNLEIGWLFESAGLQRIRNGRWTEADRPFIQSTRFVIKKIFYAEWGWKKSQILIIFFSRCWFIRNLSTWNEILNEVLMRIRFSSSIWV